MHYPAVRKGWNPINRTDPRTLKPDAKGIFHIGIRQLEPLEIIPAAGTHFVSASYIVKGKQRLLPPGAALYRPENTFRWMPGVGFNGKYRFRLNVRNEISTPKHEILDFVITVGTHVKLVVSYIGDKLRDK